MCAFQRSGTRPQHATDAADADADQPAARHHRERFRFRASLRPLLPEREHTKLLDLGRVASGQMCVDWHRFVEQSPLLIANADPSLAKMSG